MTEEIKKELEQIEQEKGIRILLACETGSRAWGFPSPDSDYDIRLIYAHPKDWYISLTEPQDYIDLMLADGELDITGWDIRKALRLLSKSNVPMLERIQSPIVYKKDDAFVEQIWKLAKGQFSPIATMHHYWNMASNTKADYEGMSEYKLKKLFYALRATMACKWILDKDSVPPIEFKVMLEQLELPSDLKTRIDELIKLKATKDEAYMHPREQLIDAFIEVEHNRAFIEKGQLKPAKGDKEDLNDFLRAVLI